MLRLWTRQTIIQWMMRKKKPFDVCRTVFLIIFGQSFCRDYSFDFDELKPKNPRQSMWVFSFLG